MFEKIKYVVSYVKAVKKVQESGLDLNSYINNLTSEKELEVQGHEIKVVTDDTSVFASGFRYGLCNVMPDGGITIVKETKAAKLGIEDFLIHHEIGHLVNEVFNNPFSFMMNIRSLVDEQNADLYSARQIGFDKALEALSILAKDKSIDTNEIKLRIEFIERAKAREEKYAVEKEEVMKNIEEKLSTLRK